MSEQHKTLSTGLTRADLSQSTVQAILKGIPWIGESLSHFIFGPLDALRWRRLQQTLHEIGEAIKDGKRVEKEEFVALLEKVGPKIAYETSEQRRQFFRDLLVNAAGVEPGSPRWADANLAAELIAEIEPPGLAILAAIARCQKPAIYISSQPTPRVIDGGESFEKSTETFRLLDYGWPVIEEWFLRLRERRLVAVGSVDARGGFGAVQLGALGKFLVEWGLRPETPT